MDGQIYIDVALESLEELFLGGFSVSVTFTFFSQETVDLNTGSDKINQNDNMLMYWSSSIACQSTLGPSPGKPKNLNTLYDELAALLVALWLKPDLRKNPRLGWEHLQQTSFWSLPKDRTVF